MSKIPQDDFKEGMEAFMSILKSQPGFIHPRHPAEAEGTRLAEMAFGFINHFHEMKQKHVSQDQE